MRALIAFDTGGAVAGWAALDDDAQLVGAGLSRCKEKPWQLRAQHHRRVIQELMARLFRSPVRVRAEMMWFRQKTKKRKNAKGQEEERYIPPQDLIDLNLVAGHVGTEWVYPHQWKGLVSKKIHQPKILAVLNEKELAIVEAVMPESLRHNAIDAVGIALHAAGRLQVEGQCHQPPKLPAQRSSRSSKSTPARGRGSSPRSTKRRGNAPRQRSSSSARKKLSSFRTEPLLIPERLTKQIAPGPDTQTSGYLDIIRKT